jgi:hypothetical protein
MRESAWSEIDTTATQFPIPEAGRLRPLAAADLARWGRSGRCCGRVFAVLGFGPRVDSDLIF